MNAKDLRGEADQLFSNRSTLMMLWQEQAENFYPERADFTFRRTLGTEFADNLFTSYPLICRRSLGDQISTMLRPTAKRWFHMTTGDEEREDHEARRWMQWAEKVQHRAMYDPVTHFTRATKEGDHDYATFGQCAISVRLNRNRDALLYRCWHLRDMAWKENAEGNVCFIARKWRATSRDLEQSFGTKNLDQKILDSLKNGKPFTEWDVLHMIVEADLYDDDAKGKPYWSIYYDCANEKVIEAVAQWNKEYLIPRWQTVSGSQYAFSPATVAALPDGRLLQAMTLTLLEAGEMIARPAMVATQDVIRSDIGLYPGGITWVDRDYDEKLGEALRPISTDAKGMPLTGEMQADVRSMLVEAFYLNKLQLPQRTAEMTAYEVGQRVQEYIRGALPLFEPMEVDYNGQLCELTFDVLMRAGAFGSPYEIPESLRDTEVRFRFESPLHDAIEQQKGQKFLEAKSYIAEAIAMEPGAAAVPDVITALRDVLASTGVPAKWIRSEGEADKIVAGQKKAMETQQLLASMQQGSDIAATLGTAQREQAQAQALAA